MAGGRAGSGVGPRHIVNMDEPAGAGKAPANHKARSRWGRAHGTFSRVDHMLGHKASLGRFQETEIITSIFCNHNTMRLEINYMKKTERNTNMWRLNNMLLNNQWITEEIKEGIKKYLETDVAKYRKTWCQEYRAPWP